MIVVSAMITIAEGKGDEYVAHFAKLRPWSARTRDASRTSCTA